ncbi:hypothetical protein AwErysi_01350 [Erysipelotrichaceae bacterium]|nr:hypothetical protein AwErysi_01350 [Erysipelotrichaceae bacterium]
MNKHLNEIITLVEDKKVPVLASYDVTLLSTFADVFVIAIASNDRQINAVMQEMKDYATLNGSDSFHSEGDPKEGWVAIQHNEVCVHIFLEGEHDKYRLDELFKACPKIS